MDAVERGQSFIVTRGGHQIGELIPLRRQRRFVSRQEFAAMSQTAPGVSPDAFRADQDAAITPVTRPDTMAPPGLQPERGRGGPGQV